MAGDRASAQRPYLIGLTGNIACGKSTVVRRLAELGAETIDGDQVVHALMEPGGPIWAAVRDGFGPGVIAPDGRIDRRALAAIVFSDPAELARLEALSHPPVVAYALARVPEAAARGVRVLVIDAIKLIESGLADHCDTLWVVTCDPAQQLARLMARNGFDEAEARRRIAAQPPQAEKVARADLVIDNSGSPEATIAQVDAAWGRIARRADGGAIRSATMDDARAVAAYVEASYTQYIARMGKPPAPMLADYGALIASGVVWVLEVAAEVVGVLVMMPEGDCLFIENVALLPAYQGRGFGRRLIAFAEESARVAGLHCLALYTNELMTENLAYYPRLGFREVGRRSEDGYRRVYLRKDLSGGGEEGR